MESWMHASQQDMSSLQEQERDATSGTGTGPGTRRSYDCTFCKHGFTNAQALGGHMNIHRKDRAKKNKRHGQSPTAPQQQSAYNHVSDSHNGIPEHYHYQHPVSVPMSSGPLSYAATIPAAAFHAQGSYGLYWPSTSEMPDQPPYGTILDDVSAGLSLGMGSGAAEEHYGNGVEKGDDDVDLELRL